MTISPPRQSRIPFAAPLAMSTATSTPVPPPPTASPIPPRRLATPPNTSKPTNTTTAEESQSQRTSPLPSLSPKPVLRLHLDDLAHPAAMSFLSVVDVSALLPHAIDHILRHLYTPPSSSAATKTTTLTTTTMTRPTPKPFHPHIPPTRSVTLILRPMDGVAYTTGLTLDPSHKEIHFNLNYIASTSPTPSLRAHEILGVVTHEMVHCYQHNALGTAPGGLIEGIADFVRLKAGLGAKHWGPPWKERGERWDAGYQKTAYFLEWIERVEGDGSVGRINERLRGREYKEEEEGKGGEGFWEGLFGVGRGVGVLWEEYCKGLDEEEENAKEEEEKKGKERKKEEAVGAKGEGAEENEDEIVVVSRVDSEGPEGTEGPAYLA